jgi:hypothetical protein
LREIVTRIQRAVAFTLALCASPLEPEEIVAISEKPESGPLTEAANETVAVWPFWPFGDTAALTLVSFAVPGSSKTYVHGPLPSCGLMPSSGVWSGSSVFAGYLRTIVPLRQDKRFASGVGVAAGALDGDAADDEARVAAALGVTVGLDVAVGAEPELCLAQPETAIAVTAQSNKK